MGEIEENYCTSEKSRSSGERVGVSKHIFVLAVDPHAVRAPP